MTKLPERPATKTYNKLSNGLMDVPGCKYVIESYIDEYKRLNQSIMFNYNDDREREYYRSTVHPILFLRKREYFDEKGKLIFLEDHKHETRDS